MAKAEVSALSLLALVLGLDKDHIPNDASIESYELWNSLHHLRIALEIERVIGRQLETKEILGIRDVDGIQHLLNRR